MAEARALKFSTQGVYIKSCQRDDKSPLKGAWFCSRDPFCMGNCGLRQEALLSQRDRATRLSVEILQLQNIAIVWHYLRDPTFSRFYTIPKCDRHTHTDRRTDRYTVTACTALSIASRSKIDHIALHTKYNYQATNVG